MGKQVLVTVVVVLVTMAIVSRVPPVRAIILGS